MKMSAERCNIRVVSWGLMGQYCTVILIPLWGFAGKQRRQTKTRKMSNHVEGEKRGADSWSGLRSLKVLKHSCPGVSVCVAVEKPS